MNRNRGITTVAHALAVVMTVLVAGAVMADKPQTSGPWWKRAW